MLLSARSLLHAAGRPSVNTFVSRAAVSAARPAASSSSAAPSATAEAMRPPKGSFVTLDRPHAFPFRSGSKLAAIQSNLPALPVPTLAETAEKYLRSLVPLLSPGELARTRATVQDFIKPGGAGEVLQRRLLDRADRMNREGSSWLADWWHHNAYMAYRDPVVVFVSYFYYLHDDPKFPNVPGKMNHTARAAALIKAALAFRQQIIDETIAPDTAKSGPLDMSQYQYMFNSCRIPEIPSDVCRLWDPETHQHLAVVRKNKFFVFDLKSADGQWLSAADITAQLNRIVCAAGEDKDEPIGALTSDNRDTWTKARNELIAAHPANAATLERIESSVLLLCLDDAQPTDRDDGCRLMWHGDGQNRFFDKSVQIIVTDNGKAGLNGEHSMMDGTPTNRLSDFMYTALKSNQIDLGAPAPRADLPEPTRLVFHTSPAVKQQIKSSVAAFNQLISAYDLKVVAFKGYGSDQVKKWGVSPDAFMQMIIQLAYYRVFGVVRATYESAQTKAFRLGRTETCRSVSVESKAWVEKMQDPSLDSAAKLDLFRKAINSQVKYMADAVNGKGVDRHLMGLRMLIEPNEVKHAIFLEPAYLQSTHWYLSTSQLSSEGHDGYGWGPVVPNGFGIAYLVQKNALYFNVTALKTWAVPEMHAAILGALKDVQKICDEGGAATPKAKL